MVLSKCGVSAHKSVLLFCRWIVVDLFHIWVEKRVGATYTKRLSEGEDDRATMEGNKKKEKVGQGILDP